VRHAELGIKRFCRIVAPSHIALSHHRTSHFALPQIFPIFAPQLQGAAAQQNSL
jgi:hypothetical protein